MAKKTEGLDGQRFIKAATGAIRNAGPLRDLYKSVHGKEPTRIEFQRFFNRLNPSRSNPGADLLGLCVQNLPELHSMTLSVFFGLEEPPAETGDDPEST